MTESPACGNCRFYAVAPADVTQGSCRRWPPQVYLAPINTGNRIGMMLSGDFPPTRRGNWCGEYQAADIPLTEGNA